MKKCPICNKGISIREVAFHFHTKHSEYKCSRKIKEGTHCFHYYCDTCGMTLGSFEHLVEHYREYHPGAIKHDTAVMQIGTEQTGVISERNLTVTDLDRLIEQVNRNTSLLQEERKKNRELLQKCTSYATRIVELQNQLAQENRGKEK